MAEELPDGRFLLYVYADATALVPALRVDYESMDADPERGRIRVLVSDRPGLTFPALRLSSRQAA